MLVKTKGIILHTLKFSENSIILKVYTDTCGLQSYIAKSTHGKKSRLKAGNFSPLSIVDLVVYQKKTSSLNLLKEIQEIRHFEKIAADIRKSAVAIFMAELLYRSIKEDAPNPGLFEYICQSIEYLDFSNERISDFHFFFMAGLSRYLGFFPQNNYDQRNIFFNMMEGSFQENLPEHPYFTDASVSLPLHELLLAAERNNPQVSFAKESRKELLQKLMDYYRIHISGFKELNSHHVLEEVFS